MNTPPITKEPATMTTKPAADTFRLARRLAKTLGFDGVQTIASAFSLDGTDYIITRGTGEGDFAYDASDVDGWLEHLGRERASYSEDFCQALTPVADVELAWAVLQEEGFALCREGDCRAVLAGERCERGSEDDIRRGTIQVMSGARAEILWDGDETPSIWTFPPALRPAQGKQFATVGSNGVELVVWGLGLSREAAEADADETLAQTVGERPELVTVPCSPATAELLRGSKRRPTTMATKKTPTTERETGPLSASVSTSPKIRRATMDALLRFLPNPNAAVTFAAELLAIAYPRALAEIRGRFTEPEARLMLDVMNGTMWIGSEAPSLVGQRIAIEVADGCQLNGLDDKWHVDGTKMGATLGGLTSFQLVALELWCGEFWAGAYNDESFEREHLAKLCGRAKAER